eukprot:Skav209470  [mRNA]  locus=scaffold3498:253617:262225:- [translate_table: standard]
MVLQVRARDSCSRLCSLDCGKEGKKEGKKERRKEGKKERRKEGKKERRKEGKKERRKEGKKERRKEGKKERRKEGKKERRKEGKKERRKEGKKERRKEGKKERRKEGKKERRKEGKKERRKEGKKERRKEGKKERRKEGKKERRKEGKKERRKEGKKERRKEGKKERRKEGKKERRKEGKEYAMKAGRENRGRQDHASAKRVHLNVPKAASTDVRGNLPVEGAAMDWYDRVGPKMPQPDPPPSNFQEMLSEVHRQQRLAVESYQLLTQQHELWQQTVMKVLMQADRTVSARVAIADDGSASGSPPLLSATCGLIEPEFPEPTELPPESAFSFGDSTKVQPGLLSSVESSFQTSSQRGPLKKLVAEILRDQEASRRMTGDSAPGEKN